MFRRRRRAPEDEYADYYDDEPSREASSRTRRRRIWPHCVGLVVLAAAALVAVGIVAGLDMVEQVVITALSPVGLVWLLLILITYWSLVRGHKLTALVGLASWLILSAAGNSLVANFLVERLERPFADIPWAEREPYEVVLVLGGGANQAPNGDARAGSSGDRVLLAARMWHAGKVQSIVCGGTHGLTSAANVRPPQNELMRTLLTELGVPADAIHLVEGTNTLEEVQAFDKWLVARNLSNVRVGIISSAWHLPRALELAHTVGVEADGLPGDFLTQPIYAEPGLWVPRADNLRRSSLALKEYVARLIGR